MGVSAGWSPEFFNEVDKFNNWKKLNPQYASANLGDWVRGGSPSQANSVLSVAPTGANNNLYNDMFADPSDPGEANVYDFWQRVDPSRGGYPAESPAGQKKQMIQEADTKRRNDPSSAERLRGRQSTYATAGGLLTDPNLFKTSLLGS